MAMTGAVTFNLGRRNIGGARQLWNRLTPTRGATATANAIQTWCAAGAGTARVERGAIQAGQRIAGSEFYSRQLQAAGVSEISFPYETRAREIKRVLDALCDRDLEDAERLLSAQSFTVAYTENGSPALSVNTLLRFPFLAERVAESNTTPAHVLTELALQLVRTSHSRSESILVKIAANPNTNEATHGYLYELGANRPEIRDSQVGNRNTPFALQERFAQEPEHVTRREALAKVTTHEAILEILAENRGYMVRIAVGKNPAATPAIVAKIILSLTPFGPRQVADAREILAAHQDQRGEILQIVRQAGVELTSMLGRQ